MSFDIKEALKTSKQREKERMVEAAYSVDWLTLVQQILAGSSSSYPAVGPSASLINTLDPRVLPAERNHDPIAIEGEDAALLKRPENWVAIARERKMQPFLSSDQLTAKAASEISSIQPARVREVWYRDHVRKILAKRGEQKE